MPTVTESGLSVNLPPDQSFRLAEMAAYGEIKAWSLKEMDFAWVEAGRLFLLEVRDYTPLGDRLASSELLPSRDTGEPFRFRALVDKVTDSVLMLLAAWSGTSWGERLRAELPAEARERVPLKVIVAVDLPAALRVHLQALRDSLNARLRGRLAVADVGRVVLIDHDRLVSLPQFADRITRASPPASSSAPPVPGGD